MNGTQAERFAQLLVEEHFSWAEICNLTSVLDKDTRMSIYKMMIQYFMVERNKNARN